MFALSLPTLVDMTVSGSIKKMYPTSSTARKILVLKTENNPNFPDI